MKGNLLVGIPLLYHGETCRKAINSVVNEADVLIIDNGSEKDVKLVIEEFDQLPNVFVIRNEENIFVNGSWNQIMKFFLKWNYQQLVIMNSDLIMSPGWSNYLIDGESSIPTDGSHEKDEIVTEGSPGVFLHLNKKMVDIVYPIPPQIRLWFGDFAIYHTIRSLGFKTIVRAGMIANHFHGGSQSIAILPNKSEIIEEDKISWDEIVEPIINSRIKILIDTFGEDYGSFDR